MRRLERAARWALLLGQLLLTHCAASTNAVGGLPRPVAADELEAEDGYRLWLRYEAMARAPAAGSYLRLLRSAEVLGESPTLDAARRELQIAIEGLSSGVRTAKSLGGEPTSLLVGTPQSSARIAELCANDALEALGPEGFVVRYDEGGESPVVVVASTGEIGALYGVFSLLGELSQERPIRELALRSSPRIERRVLNHWDNPDRSVERGYAGLSLWRWDQLPEELSPRYQDYARANASLGINGTVLNNVNANAKMLTEPYLRKVEALARVFRPYGLRVYLTARFSAPIEIGGLSSADPLLPEVRDWWARKADEIYDMIPDFGGFLVKANSEGQPGPQDYQRTHAEGANLLADALAPHGGIVMWRAFVYDDEVPRDRIRQAYDEFQPLDGEFRPNAIVQAKNGPLDFQPREPFHPLFGAMPKTSVALELQITKEYLGQDTHLSYLGPMYEEVLGADTFVKGPGSTVARVIQGKLAESKAARELTVIAGVANIGSDVDWTGSIFNQANWYVYGRMAWDPESSAEAIARQWVRRTFGNDPALVEDVTDMMMASHEAVVQYMTPLGLVHIMAAGHHYGPGPWVDHLRRADWNSIYYHRADAEGIGFDRTATGSNAVEQYAAPLRERFSSREKIDDKYLLFFHHVGWEEPLRTGRTLWEELVHRYSQGVAEARRIHQLWQRQRGKVDAARFAAIEEDLHIQADEARWWRDAALSYFGEISGQPLPEGYEAPAHPLQFYRELSCPADRTRARCPAVYE